MNSIIERKHRFDLACKELDFPSQETYQLVNGTQYEAFITWRAHLLYKLQEIFNCTVAGNVVNVALDFFENNTGFFQERNKVLFHRLKKPLCFDNEENQKRLHRLAVIADRITPSNVLLICKDEQLLFVHSSALLAIPYFKTAFTTPLKGNSLTDKAKPFFPDLEKAFTLDQFTPQSVTSCIKSANDLSDVNTITDFDLLFELYTISDYMSFDELKKICLNRVITQLQSEDRNLRFLRQFEKSECADQFFNELKAKLLKKINQISSKYFIANFNIFFEICTISHHDEFKQIYTMKIADQILLQDLPLSSIANKDSNITLFLKELSFEFLKRVAKKNLRFFLNLVQKQFPNEFNETVKSIKESMDLSSRTILSNAGNEIQLISDWACYDIFKTFPGSRIIIEGRKGTFEGMCKAGHIWVQLDNDQGAHHWTSEDYYKMGLKLQYINTEVKSRLGTIIELVSHWNWNCFKLYDLLPGERINTRLGKGIVKGMCEQGHLWVHLDNDPGISYWGNLKSYQDLPHEMISRINEELLPESYETLNTLIRILKSDV